nr:hypothetical protein [Tanacetum cinerariifolium]
MSALEAHEINKNLRLENLNGNHNDGNGNGNGGNGNGNGGNGNGNRANGNGQGGNGNRDGRGDRPVAQPTRLQDAVQIANNLMDKKLKGYAVKNAENKRRYATNHRDNHRQQPPFKR